MKSSYSNPGKGTRIYEILQIMLSKDGAEGGPKDVSNAARYLTDFCGYKIIRSQKKNGVKSRYRCVGRYTWDQKYIDFALEQLEKKEE